MSNTNSIPAAPAPITKRKIATIVFFGAVLISWFFTPAFADLPCRDSVPEWVPAFAQAQRTLFFAMTLFAVITLIRSRLGLVLMYTLIMLLIVVVSFVAFTCA